MTSVPTPSGVQADRPGCLLLLGASVLLYLDPLIGLSARNFHLSDVLFIGATVSYAVHCGPDALRTAVLRNPLLRPFLLFAAAAVASLTVSLVVRELPVRPDRTIVGVLQLGFVFLLLYPLVRLHATDTGRYRTLLWLHAGMIALAGIISISEYWGVTHWTAEPYFRQINPMLGVNGFWLFGLVSPFLMHEIVRSSLSVRSVRSGAVALLLWTCGCAGAVLSGSRAAAALVAFSFLWVGLSYVRRLRFDAGVLPAFASRAFVRPAASLSVLLAITGALLMAFPVFQARLVIEQRLVLQQERPGQAGSTRGARQLVNLDFMGAAVDESGAVVASRQDVIDRGLEGFRGGPLLVGTGLGQFGTLNPEMPITIHNVYVQLLYETGLLGLIAYLWMLGILAAPVLSHWQRGAPRNSINADGAGVECALFAVAAVLLVNLVYPLGHSRSDWALVFLCVAASRAVVAQAPVRRPVLRHNRA